MGLGGPTGHQAPTIPPGDRKNAAVWLPTNTSLRGSCEHIRQNRDHPVTPTVQQLTSTHQTEAPDLHQDRHTEFMDFFIKQTFWSRSMESMCRGNISNCLTSVSRQQLSFWGTNCCRWGLASPWSLINSWDAVSSKETLCCPKIQPNRVAPESAAPCWYIAVQREQLRGLAGGWEQSHGSGQYEPVSEETSAREEIS